MIIIDKVSFGYDYIEETLKEISFQVKKGECILLCGESGCGKTTITKLINGLIPHFTVNQFLTGNVEVGEKKVVETELYELAKQVGSVFQNPKSQFFNIDTESELAFGLENEGVKSAYINQRIETVVKEMQIDRLIGKKIFSLSGGQKQSLAFASVYVMNPDVYVLDEPTANLDYEAILRLKELIQKMKNQGKTIVIAEHRLWFLIELVNKVIYMKNGAVDQIFTKEEFRSIKEERRRKMGLRTLQYEKIQLPMTESTDLNKGLCVKDLTYAYKDQDPVFKNLSFTVNEGEITAIIGENGVGKTTLIRCLCGLLKEKRGMIKYQGEILKQKERQKKCYMVMQDVNHQLFYDSVFSECEQAAGGKEANIEEILKEFNLWKNRDKHPMALSGGQKQRLAIVTALLSDKKILIFDEPTSGLDYRHMLEVSKVLRLLASKGKIILLVTHDNELLKYAADRMLKL